MKRWLLEVYVAFLYYVFLWAGSRLFPYVSVYAPGGEDSPVRALTFCDGEHTLNSIRAGWSEGKWDPVYQEGED